MHDFSKVLIIETSSKVGQVALASNETVLVRESLGDAHRRASNLTSTASRLLDQLCWKAREITAVVVGLGPGSYTGLRVGLASAKTLAYANRCSFLGVETFAAIAMQTKGEKISIVGDALQGLLFVRNYHRDRDGNLNPTCDLKIATAEEFHADLTVDTIVNGPYAEMIANKFENTKIDLPVYTEIEAESLLQVSRRCAWAVTTDMWTAEPFYLRGSSAEEKLKQRAKSSAS